MECLLLLTSEWKRATEVSPLYSDSIPFIDPGMTAGRGLVAASDIEVSSFPFKPETLLTDLI